MYYYLTYRCGRNVWYSFVNRSRTLACRHPMVWQDTCIFLGIFAIVECRCRRWGWVWGYPVIMILFVDNWKQLYCTKNAYPPYIIIRRMKMNLFLRFPQFSVFLRLMDSVIRVVQLLTSLLWMNFLGFCRALVQILIYRITQCCKVLIVLTPKAPLKPTI